MLDMGVHSLKKRLNFDISDDCILPYVYKNEALQQLNEISRQIKEKSNDDLKWINFSNYELSFILKKYDGLETSATIFILKVDTNCLFLYDR